VSQKLCPKKYCGTLAWFSYFPFKKKKLKLESKFCVICGLFSDIYTRYQHYLSVLRSQTKMITQPSPTIIYL
jgi:hypothetical protein